MIFLLSQMIWKAVYATKAWQEEIPLLIRQLAPIFQQPFELTVKDDYHLLINMQNDSWNQRSLKFFNHSRDIFSLKWVLKNIFSSVVTVPFLMVQKSYPVFETFENFFNCSGAF